MLIIKKILVPRANGLSFIQVPVEKLEKPFEETVKDSLFSLPDEERECYYTLLVNRNETPFDHDFFITVDVDLMPVEGELFVVAEKCSPRIKKCTGEVPSGGKILGTVCKVSRNLPEEFEACDIRGSVKNKTILETIKSF